MFDLLVVLKGVFTFYEDVKVFLAFRKQYSDEQWFKEGQVLTNAIKGAKTYEERKELLRKLYDHTAGA